MTKSEIIARKRNAKINVLYITLCFSISNAFVYVGPIRHTLRLHIVTTFHF